MWKVQDTGRGKTHLSTAEAGLAPQCGLSSGWVPGPLHSPGGRGRRSWGRELRDCGKGALTFPISNRDIAKGKEVMFPLERAPLKVKEKTEKNGPWKAYKNSWSNFKKPAAIVTFLFHLPYESFITSVDFIQAVKGYMLPPAPLIFQEAS